MTGKRLIIVAALLGMLSPALCAEGGAADSADNTPPAHLNRPQDYAPAEMVIVPRPPEEYLPKGSLLSGASREKRLVDVDELRRRKLAMYEGETQTSALPASSGAPTPSSPKALPATSSAGTEYGAMAFWAFIGACALAAAGLLLHVALEWRTRNRERKQISRSPRAH